MDYPGTDRGGDKDIHKSMDERWEFNSEVTAVFDEMLERSIPQYHTMRRTVFEIGRRFGYDSAAPTAPFVLDLGCSRGEALAPFVEEGWDAMGLDVSEPMLAAAAQRFNGDEKVHIGKMDLREEFAWKIKPRPNLVLLILTLMFTPINHRQRIVQDSYDLLHDGGAMILVEKVLGRGAKIDKLMVDVYHDGKEAAGYSREEIDRKAMALEGVQVPVTAAWNESLLRGAGFREVDCFWAWCNFRGWIGIK